MKRSPLQIEPLSGSGSGEQSKTPTGLGDPLGFLRHGIQEALEGPIHLLATVAQVAQHLLARYATGP